MECDFTRTFVWFVKDRVLSGWLPRVSVTERNLKGNAADAEIVRQARIRRIPVISHEGYRLYEDDRRQRLLVPEDAGTACAAKTCVRRPRMFVVTGHRQRQDDIVPASAFEIDSFNIDDRCAQILGSHRAGAERAPSPCSEVSRSYSSARRSNIVAVAVAVAVQAPRSSAAMATLSA